MFNPVLFSSCQKLLPTSGYLRTVEPFPEIHLKQMLTDTYSNFTFFTCEKELCKIQAYV